MSSISRDLAVLLGQIRRPGDFYATGTIDIHPPRLKVEGVGPIALPLLPVQADQIISLAERAPYGRGTENLVDTDVRRTWQVGAAQVRISGKQWEQDLSAMVAQSNSGLGVTGPVEAELYKLLVYDTGSFFLPHRDCEKAPGMFATLVVVLPSDYSGGELLVRHKGREVRLDLQRDEPSEAAFAAFYADCLHEVLPIASGHRLALIYNLIRKNKSPLPKPPDYEREQQQAASLLRMWSREDTSVSRAVPDPNSGPTKLIYPLEHAYTQADWRRPSEIDCSCTYCQDLSHYLADPNRSVWLLKAAQDARSHVEGSIRSNNCDLDFVTEKKGRPYTLRCTKNQASYQRRVEQWRQDLAHLARFGNSTEDGAVATRVDDR